MYIPKFDGQKYIVMVLTSEWSKNCHYCVKCIVENFIIKSEYYLCANVWQIFFPPKNEIYNIRVLLMWSIENEVNTHSIHAVDSAIKTI